MWARAAARGLSTLARVADKDVEAFRRLVPHASGVLTDPADVAPYNEDWQKLYKGNGKVVVRPKTTAEVSAVLKYCHENALPVVPQGGNTGLVGGSNPIDDEVILSLSLMDKVLGLDEAAGVVTAQAGCILQKLDEHLRDRGFIMPLDLGAKGSCQIGGNLSTNAGGIRLIRYGSMHANCLGLEVVLADGTVLDSLRGLRKDNTGYDLKQLFVGSEGTLGVITAAAILVPPLPRAFNVAFVACPSYDAVRSTFQAARGGLGEILSAVELMDRQSLELVTSQLPGARDPLPDDPSPFYMLLETSGSNVEHDEAKVMDFLQEAMADGCVSNGTVTNADAQMGELWRLREGLAESLVRRGYVYKYDFSLRFDDLYKIVEATRERLAEQNALVVGYGHLGDGNIHLNVSTPEYDPAVKALLDPFVYDFVGEHKGSISAEHGIGQLKAKYLGRSQSDESIAVMRSIKAALDPKGILNPGKVLV